MRFRRPSLALDEIAPIAMRWVASARASFDRDDALRSAALETNFAWARVPEEERAELRAFIASHFASIEGVLRDRERLFQHAPRADVRRWFGASPPPAYAQGGRVFFTDAFRVREGETGFGRNCLAAMVVHECVHVFDARSGEPEIHVSEWDEPKFSAIPPRLQIHNASAYASYAAQVHHGELEWPTSARFGAGRPAD